jgi:GNAT superfamily N-acetyltransferase
MRCDDRFALGDAGAIGARPTQNVRQTVCSYRSAPLSALVHRLLGGEHMAAPETELATDAMCRAPTDGEAVVLRDGSTVRIRALGSSDRQQVEAFFEGLSSRSRRYRFFGARTVLPARELERLTNGSSSGTAALAAFIERGGYQGVVGIAEFSREPTAERGAAADGREEGPIRAEFAVAVADEYQDHGIGTLLLERTAQAAKRVGVDELIALVLSDDDRMLDVFHQSGFELREEYAQGECNVVFRTDQTDRSLAASAERERIAARESVRRAMS